jgi:hypothetical protein
MFNSKVFTVDEGTLFTFIDQKTGKRWSRWKSFKELTEEEKKTANLAQYPKNCLLLDKDFKETSQEEIESTYSEFIHKVRSIGMKNYLSWRSPNGFHVLISFEGLESLDSKVKTEIKRFFVERFGCDLAKVSDRGVVSLPGRPHFKNSVVYPAREEFFESQTKIPAEILNYAISKVKEREEQDSSIKKEEDQEFKDFFEKDPFWKLLKSNIFEEGTNRNLSLFPNLAIACVKSGKTKEEIKNLVKPIIDKNFPGKIYAEFEGWLRKAFSGEISEFSHSLINKWFRENFDIKSIYDLTPISVEEELKILKKEPREAERLNLIWNEDIFGLSDGKMEWLVEGWIGKGDICIFGGKSNSYKTTALLHLGLCVANGIPVFNKYPVKQSRVLYINEENHKQLIKDIFSRVYNGLDLESSKNFALLQEENLKLDVDRKTGESDLVLLAEKVLAEGIEVIILDTLRRFISFDENDATQMSLFNHRLKRLRKYCNYPTIIVMHHSKKAPATGWTDSRDEFRGSSDIVQSADSAILVERKVGAPCFKICHVKTRGTIEQGKKLIMVDGDGDPERKSYLYESETADLSKPETKIESAAEDILKFVESSKIKSFTRKELSDLLKGKHSDMMIFRALKEMEMSGEVIKQGKGKSCIWSFEPGRRTK